MLSSLVEAALGTPASAVGLGLLPRTETVKLIFACPGNLKADLDCYAALHAETYGEPVDAVTLIPHMLAAFMARDRGFRRRGARPASQHSPSA